MLTPGRWYCTVCQRRTSEDKAMDIIQCGCQVATIEALSNGVRPNGWCVLQDNIFTGWTAWYGGPPDDKPDKNEGKPTKCPHCGKDLAWQGIGAIREPVWKDGKTTCVWCNKEVTG